MQCTICPICNKCGTWRYKSGSVPVPIGLLFPSHIVCYSYHGFAQLSDKIFAKSIQYVNFISIISESNSKHNSYQFNIIAYFFSAPFSNGNNSQTTLMHFLAEPPSSPKSDTPLQEMKKGVDKSLSF